jgi:hypothetical protein
MELSNAAVPVHRPVYFPPVLREMESTPKKQNDRIKITRHYISPERFKTTDITRIINYERKNDKFNLKFIIFSSYVSSSYACYINSLNRSGEI